MKTEARIETLVKDLKNVGSDAEDLVKATYRDNYARLTLVKSRYDKVNLFRVNQNIRPVATPV